MTFSLNKTTEIFPRHIMIEAPTPLTRLNRLSDHFDIDLWIKRDDLAGPTLGGNKTRQLEYYFGAALAKGSGYYFDYWCGAVEFFENCRGYSSSARNGHRPSSWT